MASWGSHASGGNDAHSHAKRPGDFVEDEDVPVAGTSGRSAPIEGRTRRVPQILKMEPAVILDQLTELLRNAVDEVQRLMRQDSSEKPSMGSSSSTRGGATTVMKRPATQSA